MRVRD
jgi:dynein light intermediate chain